MNMVLIWAMAVTAFIVTIMGGVLLAVMLFYGMYRLISSIWERTSAVAKNTKEFMMNREDFELYKRDVEIWDEMKSRNIEKCFACVYRKQSMNEEDNHDT